MTWPAVPLTNPWATGYVNATTMYNNTTLPLNELQAVFVTQGVGTLGHNVNGTTIVLSATSGSVASVTIAVVAGRKYRYTGSWIAVQTVATSVVNANLTIAGTTVDYLQFATVAAGITCYGTAVAFYTPGTSANITFTMVAATSAGTLSIGPGAFVLVEDMGTV